MHQEAIGHVKAWIQLRKQEPCFKLKSTSELNQATDVICLGSGSILYALTNGKNILILFKPTCHPETLVIPEGYQLTSTTITVNPHKTPGTYEIIGTGTTIFMK